MYEEIDLDAIESNKDEAPDYRPLLRSGLSAPVDVDTTRYRVRILSTLESEERSRYEEFARIADEEGLAKIAGVFRNIMKEEQKHAASLPEIPKNRTVTNVKASIVRENEKIEIIKSMLDGAEEEGDAVLSAKLRRMLAEEQGHVMVLKNAMGVIERRAAEEKPAATEEEPGMVCEFGKCVKKSRFESEFDHLSD